MWSSKFVTFPHGISTCTNVQEMHASHASVLREHTIGGTRHSCCRGNLTATVPGQSLCKAPQTYLAQHSTAPPEEQIITTDPENVLLRVLKLSQKREGPKGKSDKGKAAEKNKRYSLPQSLGSVPCCNHAVLIFEELMAMQARFGGSRGCACQQKAKHTDSSCRLAK